MVLLLDIWRREILYLLFIISIVWSPAYKVCTRHNTLPQAALDGDCTVLRPACARALSGRVCQPTVPSVIGGVRVSLLPSIPLGGLGGDGYNILHKQFLI